MIEFRDAAFAVGGRTLLGPLSLSVSQGETLVLLGSSGAGKTTALRLINALLLPSAGDVLVEGRSTGAWDPVALRRRIGYVIQEIGLLPHLTVEQNVGLVPRLERWPRARIRARVAELLDVVRLPAADFAKRLPRELSGGQRQRVGVARALAADPPMLLCDEPFGAVDPLARQELQGEFRALAERFGKTVVFVTHDVREALTLARHVALLEGGRVAFLGSVEEFGRSTAPRVAALRELA